MFNNLEALANRIKALTADKGKTLALPSGAIEAGKKKMGAGVPVRPGKASPGVDGQGFEVLRKEKNFLQFPFFVLGKGRGLDKIEVTDIVYDKYDNKAEIYWSVIGSKKYGSPGLMEMKVNNYVERVIDRLPKPIENPIRVGTFYEICKAIGKPTVSGSDIRDIKKAIKCIVSATIETKFTFWLKDSEEYYGEPVFHRYDMAFFTGDKMSDGGVADGVYVWLGEPYRQSINANYTVPIDYEYYETLSLPISKRLYEFYSLQFYPVFKKNLKVAKVRYSKLCKYAPLTRHKVFSYLNRQLGQTHKEFIDTGFFKSVDIEKDKEGGDWLFSICPGKRARSWYVKSHKFEEQLPLFTEGEDKVVFDQLLDVGITKQSAFGLLQEYSLEAIRAQIEWLPFRKPDNAPAVLFKAIQEEWSAPTAYIKRKKEADKKKKEDRLKAQQEKLEQKKIELEEAEAKKLEAFYRGLTQEERGEVDRLAEKELPDFLKEKRREAKLKGEESFGVEMGIRSNRNKILKEMMEEKGRGQESPEMDDKI